VGRLPGERLSGARRCAAGARNAKHDSIDIILSKMMARAIDNVRALATEAERLYDSLSLCPDVIVNNVRSALSGRRDQIPGNMQAREDDDDMVIDGTRRRRTGD
jgi:hypothetical protein